MSALANALSVVISDPGIVEYIEEVAESIDSEEDFTDIVAPILNDLPDVVSSEDDAIELCGTLYRIHMNSKIQAGEMIEKMAEPIILSSLIDSVQGDPFEEDRLAQARLQRGEVGHVDDEAPDLGARTYIKTLRKEEKIIEQTTQRRLVAIEEENAQFKHGMEFRRPEQRWASHIKIAPITVTIGSHTLIEDAALTISPGNRYGLVGRNGLGKTTLMKFINSSLLKGVPNGMLIQHVQQEAPISEKKVIDAVLDTDIERTELMAELNNMKDDVDPDRYKYITDRLDIIDAQQAPARASLILQALGFDAEMQQKPVSSCSGGFRMRISLAQALYSKPDLLLLDEPTGHLDAGSVCWLEEFLTSHCKDQMLIVISHDRVFLNNVTTHTIHLKDKKLTLYHGNYESFVSQFESRAALNDALAKKQEDDIAKKMDYIRTKGARVSGASQAQSKLKSINKIERVERIQRDPPVHFELHAGPQAAQDNIITLENASFAYPNGKSIFKDLDFIVKRNTRAVIVGNNGAGKSTLIKLLMGHLTATSGFHQIVNNLRIAYFSQHHVDQLNYNGTPIQYLIDQFRSEYPLHILRAELGKFGLNSDQSLQPIQSLSGGQKTRVVLAGCALQRPQLLLMDEVTNNLDMDSISALGEALQYFGGAIIAVTHDQHFSQLIRAQLYIVEDNTVKEFPGTFQEYRDNVKETIRDQFFKSSINKGII